MASTKLSVNLNKIALLRNARGADFPNVLKFAELCVGSGTHGLTVHPRPDQRHATYQDVRVLSEYTNSLDDIEFNIEGYPTEDFLDVVIQARPDQCTLVPDAPDQITSDHGWDVATHMEQLQAVISRLQSHGIRTSIFLDPDPDLVAGAAQTGTERIELYTEDYAKSFGTERQEQVLEQYRVTAQAAQRVGLQVNAGHDLNQENLPLFLTIPGILEVSIGHAITVESLLEGFELTVRNYVKIVESS